MRLFSRLGTETVTIFVGPQSTRYVIHKTLLCASVPYFDKAFNGSFLEAQSNEIHLNDETDDPAAFSLFCQWLYTKWLPAVPRQEEWENIDFADVATQKLIDAAESPYHSLYYLAGKWCMASVKNMVLDCIRNFHYLNGNYVYSNFIAKGYANTSTGSPFRRYLSDVAAYAINSIIIPNEFIDSLSSAIGPQEQEFWVDLIRAMRRDSASDEVIYPDNPDETRYYEDEPTLGSELKEQD